MKKILKFLESKILLIQELESKITELEIKLSGSYNKIYELESEIESKSFDRLDLFNEKTTLKTELENAIKSVESQNERISKLIIWGNDNEAKNKILEQENKDLVLSNEINYNKIVEYQTEISNLKKIIELSGTVIKDLSNKEIDKIAELKIKLSEFFKDLLIEEDLEDLLDKFDYEDLLELDEKEINASTLISGFLIWGGMKKESEYWCEIHDKINDMKNEPIFTI